MGDGLQPRDLPQQGSRWGSPPKREGWQSIVQASGLQEPAIHGLECQEVRPQLPGWHILKVTSAFFTYIVCDAI